MINTTNIVNENIDQDNALIKSINDSITGRVCVTNYLHNLLHLKRINNTRVYVETGVYFGGSMCLAIQDSTPCYHIGVDIFDGFYGGGKPDAITKDVCTINTTKQNIAMHNKHNHKVDLIKGSSYDENTVKEVKHKLKSQKIDMLMIDGDHSKTGVLRDYNSYKDLISPGGIIIFDNYGEPGTWPEVKPAVDSINLTDDNFKSIGQYGWSYIIKKDT